MIEKDKNTVSKAPLLLSLIVSSFIARLFMGFVFGDLNMENEWGTLFHSLYNHKSYSFYQFGDQLIPSVYMPPLYPFFLYFLKIISFEKLNFLNLIIFVQALLTTYSVYIFYKINQKIFSEKISIVNSFIFSFIPLNLYTTGQISSISLQILLSLLFIQSLFFLHNQRSIKNIIIFSIVSGLLFLIRGEFALIFIITVTYLIFYKTLKFIDLFKIVLITLIIISPYVVRNYLTFEKITIVKSLGYNLWKGNNQLSLVEGSGFVPRISFDNSDYDFKDQNLNLLKKKVDSIKINDDYEIERDRIFLEEAKKNIFQNPYRYFSLFISKLFSYYFIDFNSNYPNYYNLFHLLPIIMISILSFPGIIIAFKKNNFKVNYLLIYLLLNIIIFSIFLYFQDINL